MWWWMTEFEVENIEYLYCQKYHKKKTIFYCINYIQTNVENFLSKHPNSLILTPETLILTSCCCWF